MEAVLAFHRAAGVDAVLAVDHGSTDGTADILRHYQEEGLVTLLREEGEGFAVSRSHLARLAATSLGADWVLHPDGDEFWWPRGGSWRELLALVPGRWGVLRGIWRHFVPRPDGPGHFAERLLWRVSPYADVARPELPFHPGTKVAHRAHPAVELKQGAHDVVGESLRPLRGWYPFEILHFPLRGLEQARRKYAHMHRALTASGLHLPPHVERAAEEIAAGRWQEVYRELTVDDEELARGLADGTLVRDTRLRDALRALAGVAELPARPAFPPPGSPLPALDFSLGSAAEQAAYAHDCEVVYAREADVRLRRRVEELERRLAACERGTVGHLLARLRRGVGPARRPPGSRRPRR